MSDTPRNDIPEDSGDDFYRDPTAPSDTPSYGESSSSGTPEHTEQLPTGGDTQQVPTESSTPPPPPAPPGPAPASPYAAPSGDAPQNPYASPPAGEVPQNPYASPPAGQSYPSQDEVAAQHGSSATPPPPGYGQAPGYGTAPAYGQPPYGAPTGYAPGGGSLSGNTIALLVVSGLMTLGGCGTGIPALVLAIIAVTKKDQPSEMAKWTKWGWVALGVTLLLVVLAFVAIFSIAAVSGSTSP